MRKPRIVYPGAFYHVICRGNNRQAIFRDDADRLKYLEILSESRELFQLKLFAYALMSNHVHLLIQTPDANISQAMKWLNWSYCTCFNRRHFSAGHLFENRFKAKLVQKDKYLLALLRYIHLNPLKAGLCKKTEDYPWTSHRNIMEQDNSLVEATEVLGLLNSTDAVNAYIEFMAAGPGSDETELFNKQRSGIIGDKSFRRHIRLQKVA